MIRAVSIGWTAACWIRREHIEENGDYRCRSVLGKVADEIGDRRDSTNEDLR